MYAACFLPRNADGISPGGRWPGRAESPKKQPSTGSTRKRRRVQNETNRSAAAHCVRAGFCKIDPAVNDLQLPRLGSGFIISPAIN